MGTKGMRPATRDDVAGLGRRLMGRIDRAGTRLDSRLDALEAKIDGAEKRLDIKTDRIAARLVRFEAKVDRSFAEVAARFDRIETMVTEKLESFATRMETLWRESALLPRVVDDHGTRLRALESRVSTLESKG